MEGDTDEQEAIAEVMQTEIFTTKEPNPRMKKRSLKSSGEIYGKSSKTWNYQTM